MKSLKYNTLLVLIVINAIYSLGFGTQFRVLRADYRDVYDAMQVANQTIFVTSLILIVIFVLVLISGYKKSVNTNLFQKIADSLMGISIIVISILDLTSVNKLMNLVKTTQIDDYAKPEMLFTIGHSIFILLPVVFIAFTILICMKKRGK